MKIGYARVSTGLQNLDLQEDSLNKFGCEKIFTDHMSGAKSNRPGLEMAIDFCSLWRYTCRLAIGSIRTEYGRFDFNCQSIE